LGTGFLRLTGRITDNIEGCELRRPIALRGIVLERIDLFRHLVAMAASDGEFKESEVQMLAVRANQWNITQDQFEDIIADIKSGKVDLKIPGGLEDKIELLKNMMHMMAIDGELAEEEKRMCAMASAKMGFTSEQFDRILDDLLRDVL